MNANDFMVAILLLALLMGVQGWVRIPFTSAISWIIGAQEGVEHDWGWELASSLAVPIAWMFGLMEIYVLYFK